MNFKPYALRKAPSINMGVLVVAIAGPAMNLLVAALAALPFRLGLLQYSDQPLPLILLMVIGINLILVVFNLIPFRRWIDRRCWPVCCRRSTTTSWFF